MHDGIADALLRAAAHLGAGASGSATCRSAPCAWPIPPPWRCLQLPAGMLAERVGERALLAAGSVLAGVAFALLATSQSYAALGALILLAGTGSAVQHPIASTLISRVYAAASRRAALGVYNFVGDVGKMVVAAAMGLGIVAIGWRSSVVLYGSSSWPWGCSRSSRSRSSSAPRRPRARLPAAPASAPGWGFTDPTGFALLGAIQLIDSACRTGFLTFFPFLLIAKGASVASIGFGLSLVFVGGAAGKLVCGLIAERVGILRTVILTELATGALIAAVVLAPLELGDGAAHARRRGAQRHIVGALRHRRRVRARRPPEPLLRPVLYARQRGGRDGAVRVWPAQRFRRRADCAHVVAALAITTVPVALLLDPHIARHGRA